MEEVTEVEQLRAALAARDADLAARDADLAAGAADLETTRMLLTAALSANQELAAQLEQMKVALAKLQEQVARNSSNSNLPPSSDPPGGTNAKPRRTKGKRRPGGQKGHKGAHRQLLPAEEMDEFIDLYPAECKSCWRALPETPDARARRYQHTELLLGGVQRTEYRRHTVTCPCCGHPTRADYDTKVIPRSAFGPRLMAVVVLLTGRFHLSRRMAGVLLHELFGVRISLGAISNIERRMSEMFAGPAEEAKKAAQAATIKHTDGTTWLRPGKPLRALWTLATAAVTVFAVLPDGSRATLEEFVGAPRGILISDRAAALRFWVMKRRQICWAHLLRKFIGFSERAGPTGRFGTKLREYVGVIFGHWRAFKSGRLSRAKLRELMAPVRARFEAQLESAKASGLRGLAGSCANILEHREALWTFVDSPGVEPTNNHAERELRRFVLWRKRSFGAQSERGDRFAARVMTVAYTARKQGRDVLGYFIACARAWSRAEPVPALLAA